VRHEGALAARWDVSLPRSGPPSSAHRPAGCTLTTSATVRLWIAIAGLSAVAVGLLLSPFRHARAADMALGSA